MAAQAEALTPGKTTRQQVGEFLAQKRVAVIGVSRNPRDFTRTLLKEFRARGYDVIPVNPGTEDVEGMRCYPSVKDVQPPATAVLLMTTPEVTEQVIDDCLSSGVRHVWMYRATGRGAVSGGAVTKCRERGVNVVAGECPFMFFPKTGFLHRVHGVIRKISGSYPK